MIFRALADLRIWFFRRLAQRMPAGIGGRSSGDLLGRLVSDVEALDGLYLRAILPGVAAEPQGADPLKQRVHLGHGLVQGGFLDVSASKRVPHLKLVGRRAILGVVPGDAKGGATH